MKKSIMTFDGIVDKNTENIIPYGENEYDEIVDRPFPEQTFEDEALKQEIEDFYDQYGG